MRKNRSSTSKAASKGSAKKALPNRKAADLYKDWHWGRPHTHVIDWPEEPYPDYPLVSCGTLHELHYKAPGALRKTRICLTAEEKKGSYLVFDPHHPHQRLYIMANAALRRRLNRGYRQNPRYENGTQFAEQPLPIMAQMVGGRHGTPDYPPIPATPVGLFTHVVYSTEKVGDGFSHYIHQFGEESGIAPVLAVDELGRPWVVGGNYTSPVEGITD